MNSRLNLNSTHILHPLLQGVFWIIWFGLILAGIISFTLWFKFLCMIAVLCLGYARWIEPRWIQIKRYTISLAEKPTQTTRVAFLSDFHAGHEKRVAYYDQIVSLTQKEQPDLILLGGDFVEERHESIQVLSGFKQLQAKLGVFGILGNHDFMDRPQPIIKALEGWGVKNIANQSLVLKTAQPLELMALEDNWFGYPNVELLRQPKSAPRMLLIHEPDELLDVEAGEADLIFIGHTHGGQVRLPGIGPLAPLPQLLPRTYDRGVLTWKGIPIVISQGIGESGFGIRFFCRPQIVIVDVLN